MNEALETSCIRAPAWDLRDPNLRDPEDPPRSPAPPNAAKNHVFDLWRDDCLSHHILPSHYHNRTPLNMNLRWLQTIGLLSIAVAASDCSTTQEQISSEDNDLVQQGERTDENPATPTTSSPLVTNDALGRERLVFTFPSCMPHCSASDVTKALEEGVIEKRIVSAIESATTTVDFAMFTFSRQGIYNALLAAVRRGVRVRGIMDRAQFKGLGDACKMGECVLGGDYDTPSYLEAPLDERLAKAAQDPRFQKGTVTEKLAMALYRLPNGSGVRVAPGKDRLVHHKFVQVDSGLLWTGSGNWSSTAMSVNLENLARFSRDTDAPVLDAFSCTFELVFKGDSNQIAKQTVNCQTPTLFFSPAGVPSKSVGPYILASLDSATKSIDISMHHLVYNDFFDRLQKALARGVAVRIVFDDDDCNAALPPEVGRLIEAGAVVRYLPTNCKLFQLSHNKYGIIDGVRVINGSGNWSSAGISKNYENFIIYDAAPDVQGFTTHFEKVFTLAQPREACTCDASTPECREAYCLDQTFSH